MTKNIIIISALVLLMASCAIDTNEVGTKEPPTQGNYIVLLDLSDRLIHTDQATFDQSIIQHVFVIFEQQVRQNLIVNSKDRFQVVIAPQRHSSIRPEVFEQSLFLDMGSLPVQYKRKTLDAFRDSLSARLSTLYEIAHQGDRPEDYFGCDIWKYFHDRLPLDIDTGMENHLVILTDGYLDFESYDVEIRKGNKSTNSRFISRLSGRDDWKEYAESIQLGLLPATELNRSLSIFVCGIRSKSVALEENAQLVWMWEDWLQGMGVKDFSTCLHTHADKARLILSDAL